MSAVFKKLNFKDQKSIVVYNAPGSFEAELALLKGAKILRDAKSPKAVEFALAFAQTQKELDRLSKLLAAGAAGDAILWFAYPKGTSKRFACEFNRDNGFQVIRDQGFDSVRQVAIDEDWSALRFRNVKFIKQ
ncbi:MAG TPA: hypothetical protein VGI93_22785 [Steroidobacteraceae bacterium]|jgi:hypothetical protein